MCSDFFLVLFESSHSFSTSSLHGFAFNFNSIFRVACDDDVLVHDPWNTNSLVRVACYCNVVVSSFICGF